jgi:hypothetical protein
LSFAASGLLSAPNPLISRYSQSAVMGAPGVAAVLGELAQPANMNKLIATKIVSLVFIIMLVWVRLLPPINQTPALDLKQAICDRENSRAICADQIFTVFPWRQRIGS